MGWALVAIGGLVTFVFWIILVIKGFKTNVWWGLGNLFISIPVAIIFGIMFPAARKAMLLFLAGFILYIIGYVIAVVPMMKEAMEQQMNGAPSSEVAPANP
ncbi:MAG: hypothetical protein R3F31_15985 [Verrucomicrobiales bacterium]|nr:hypothetical protein [Verrucomicrobiales bacterium]